MLNKYRNDSILHTALVELRLHFIGDLVKTIAAGADFKSVVVDAHFGHAIQGDGKRKTRFSKGSSRQTRSDGLDSRLLRTDGAVSSGVLAH